MESIESNAASDSQFISAFGYNDSLSRGYQMSDKLLTTIEQCIKRMVCEGSKTFRARDVVRECWLFDGSIVTAWEAGRYFAICTGFEKVSDGKKRIRWSIRE